jgi:hypothetical protein
LNGNVINIKIEKKNGNVSSKKKKKLWPSYLKLFFSMKHTNKLKNWKY